MAGPIQSSLSGALGAVANATTIGKGMEELKERGKTAKEQSKTAKESLKEQREAEQLRLKSQLEETEADITELKQKGESLSVSNSDMRALINEDVAKGNEYDVGKQLEYYAGKQFKEETIDPSLQKAYETGSPEDIDTFNRFAAFKELGHRFVSKRATRELLENQLKDLQGRIKEEE